MAEEVSYYKEEMELFWRFIVKRHLIYKKKDIKGEPAPWTEDQILANYKFTNIFRTFDRGTKYVTNHIMHHELSPEDMIFNVIAYRLFNKIETSEEYGFLRACTYDPERLDKQIHEYALTTRTVFTSAFIVSGYSMVELSGMDKISRIAMVLKWIRDQIVYNDYAIVDTIMQDTTMEATYKALIGLTGLGPFLAYQIAVDLSYWAKTKFGEDDFVIMGPGAKRGIDWIFPEHEVQKHKAEFLCFWLRDRQYEFWKDYDVDPNILFDDCHLPYVSVMALENVCCEFQKYMKALTNEGRPRNKYDGSEGQQRLVQYRQSEGWNTDPINIYHKYENMAHYTRITGNEQV